MPRKTQLLLGLLLLALLSRSGSAQTLYYDTNGATPGTSTSSTTDSTQSVWTTDSTGSSATETYVDGSNIVFSASDGVNVGTGTQNYTFVDGGTVADLTVNDGTVTVVAAGAVASSVDINGVASGSLSLDATDGDTIALNNASNKFTGTVTAEDGGAITVGHLGSLNGNTVDLNGGLFSFTYFENYSAYTNAIVLGTGGGNISVNATSGPDDAVYTGTITGGTGLTLTAGDLLEGSTDGSNNVGTLTIDSGARILALQGGIFANNAVVDVQSGGILDFSFGGTLGNQINLTDGAIIASRGGYTTLTNVSFPTTGTIGLGSDDQGGGTIEIQSNIDTGTGLTLEINGNNNINATPVILSGVISGSGSLTLSRGQDQGSYLTINNNNNSYSGATTINDLTVHLGNSSGNAFGSSVVTLNDTTLMVDGGYYNSLNTNEFILGTGTNTIEGGGISSFSGYFVQGEGSELHIEGSNNTFVGNANKSDIGTLDVDGGRLFLVGSNGLNLFANDAVVNVNNIVGNPFGAAFLDFSTGQDETVTNEIHFASGTGLQMRGNSNVTLTDAYLPTAGRFVAGSDDTSTTGSFTLTKGVTLTGDLTFDIGNSNGSSVPVTMQGAIGGSGGIIQNNLTYGNPDLFILAGTNTYSGDTTITSGTMQIASTGSLPSGTVVTEGGSGTSGTLVLGDSTGAVDMTIAGLTTYAGSTGNSVVGGSTSVSSLTVNNAADDTYAGTIGGAGTNQNNVSVTKSGAGTLTLSGTNTYTGGTTVAAGKLAVDGSIAGNAVVQAGAELGGHGSIAGIISGAGAVGPGNSPGILTAASVDPSDGTSFNFELTLAGMPDYTNAAASGNDILHLTGGTPFLSALGSDNAIDLYFSGVGTYDGGFFVDGSDSLTAAVAGATFNYYVEDDANGAYSYNGIKYDLATGSESVIAATFGSGGASGYTEQFTAETVIPEPSAMAMMFFGGLGLLFLARRAARKSI